MRTTTAPQIRLRSKDDRQQRLHEIWNLGILAAGHMSILAGCWTRSENDAASPPVLLYETWTHFFTRDFFFG